MARYVVPMVVLLALVGGYVVGQQPGPTGTRQVGGSNPNYQWAGGDVEVDKVQPAVTSPRSVAMSLFRLA